jgi:hypothetical protein
MPSKLDPFLRILRLLGKSSRFGKNAQAMNRAVDRAFAGSMKNRQIQQAMTRKIERSLSGSNRVAKYTVKADPLGTHVARAGRVTSRWNYRRSLGHLAEDGAARSDGRKRVLFTNPNKDTNRPGIDHGYLSFDKKGRFVITASDVKAQQSQVPISRVSAQGKNLAKNLQDERAKALAAARDKARPYGERVYYRSVSMALNKVLNGNPKSKARSISAAIKRGTLRLEVRNDGGNATGLSKRLQKRMIFDDRRLFKDGKLQINKFRHGLIDPKIRKRYGLSGNTTMQRFPSRHAELSRRRGKPSEFSSASGQSTIERFRARLAEGKQKQAKPARPVGNRSPQKSATGQKAPKQVGTRSAASGTSAATGQAKSIGARPARPSGGTGNLSRTKGGGSAVGGSKIARPAPVYRPFGRPHGHG